MGDKYSNVLQGAIASNTLARALKYQERAAQGLNKAVKKKGKRTKKEPPPLARKTRGNILYRPRPT